MQNVNPFRVIFLSLLILLLFSSFNIANLTLAQSSIEATLISLNSQNFPFVYLDVAVAGIGDVTLTASNFEVYENGTLQQDYFEVTPPDQGGGMKLVDIVFLMDNSGSMGPEHDAVSNNVIDFVNDLSASGFDFALGLCRFGADENGGNPIIEDNGNLTSDINYFQNDLWPRNVTSGSFEPGWDALYESATSFNFRPGALKVFILITDETPTDNGNVGTYSKNEAISILQNNSITTFALVELSDAHADEDYCTIADATNGECYDILTPFDDIFDFISTHIANTYRIRYKSSNPTFDGTQRNVEVVVTYQGDQDTCTGSYIPGAAPKIQRTQDTLDLHDQPWAAGTEFTIKADITDNVAPYVQSATLYYRTTGDATYSSTPMTAHSDEYWGTIPGSAVETPGVDYYISATDGQSTVTNPSVDPRNNPHQLAILPNEAPQITHTPVTTSAPATAIEITAEIVDTTNALWEAKLFYRKTGQILYQEIAMTNTGGDTFSAQIPSNYVTGDGVDYYIYAEDDLGVGNYSGTPDNPHQISVEAQEQPQPVITAPLTIFASSPYYPYQVGDTLTATFSITNIGGAPITFDILVVGGRVNNEVVDFEKARNITLNPGDTYDYVGNLVLGKSGTYHFFCAYHTKEHIPGEDQNNWNTNIPVEVEGKIITDADKAQRYRTISIVVLEKVTYIAPPTPRLWNKIHGPWEEISDDMTYGIRQITADQNNPASIYVVVDLKGKEGHLWNANVVREDIFKLSSGGWKKLKNDGLPSGDFWDPFILINAIAVAPSDPNVIYVGGEKGGVYRSVDGGESWTPLEGPKVGWWIFGRKPRIFSLAVDPIDPTTVYAGTESGAWRKKDGGEWEQIRGNIVPKIETDPYKTGIIYAGSIVRYPEGIYRSGGIHKFEDSGHSWKAAKGIVEDIAIGKKGAVYVATGSYLTKFPLPGLTRGALVPFPIFADGILRYDGSDWENRDNWHDARGKEGRNPLPDMTPYSVATQPNFPNMVFVAFPNEGVKYSPDFGNNWFPLGLKGKDIKELVLSPDPNSPILYAYGPENLFKLKLSNTAIIVRQHSTGELRVYDSEGNITGLINGEVREQIPNSLYSDEAAIIFSPSESYSYELAGTETGLYGLELNSVEGSEIAQFTAIDIPTTSKTIHKYTVDWDALSQGEGGITVQVDSNGDGTFEETVNTGNTLGGTEEGSNIKEEFPNQGATLIFNQVTTAGLTGLTVIGKLPFDLLPRIQFLNNFYQFETTANFTGNVTIIINYDDTNLTSAQEHNLKLYKITEEGETINITTNLDTEANTVTGKTDSFSYFGLSYGTTEPFFDNMELGKNGWNSTGAWRLTEDSDCADPQAGYSSPTHAWYYGSNQCKAEGSGYLTSRNIDVSGADQVLLTFDYLLKHKPTGQIINWNPKGEVEVAFDGSGWNKAKEVGISDSWQTVQVNRTVPDGVSHMQLRFKFTAGDPPGFGGWFIDDVRVERVTVSTQNNPPTADAGSDQNVAVGDTVKLDGGNSSDPDGDNLQYKWEFTSKPSGSTATLSDPKTMKPTFIVDKQGEYILQLTVDDGKGGTDTDQVKITAQISKTLFFDDMESGKDGWTANGEWGLEDDNKCAQPQEGYSSPTHAWYYGNAQCRAPDLGYLTSPPIDLASSDQLKIYFDYLLKHKSTGDIVSWDPKAELEVRYDGGSWEKVYQASIGNSWRSATVDLNPPDGASTIKIRFKFKAGDPPGIGGWFIDDVKVEAFTSQSTSSILPDTEEGKGQAIEEFNVEGIKAYPNPVKSTDSVTIEAVGTGIQSIQVKVFGILGGLVFEGEETGNVLEYDCRDNQGKPLPNGIYIYIVVVNGYSDEDVYISEIRKLVILR